MVVGTGGFDDGAPLRLMLEDIGVWERIEGIEVGNAPNDGAVHSEPVRCGLLVRYNPDGPYRRFRPRPETPLSGLYLTSTRTSSGPGFGPAVAGGVSAARRILKKTQMIEATQPAT